MNRKVKNWRLSLTEAEVKRQVEDYLQYQTNLGKLMYLRLNSGELVAVAGETRRRIKLCPPGTADFVVLQGKEVRITHLGEVLHNLWEPFPICEVTFIECKSTDGKTSKGQDEFAEEARRQHCRYFVVRDVDELSSILTD